MVVMRAPFPYFGGKSKVAAQVWAALGQPKHYIEPFFGSGAVLLLRPDYNPHSHIESVCDKDGFVCNVWRALQFAPDEVARWCDWPVNHADLSARKKELIRNEERLLENLIAEPKWFDATLAGYWIWAASCWIGSELTRNGGQGVQAPGQIPHISDGGKGVHAPGKIPHIGTGGKGVHAPGQRPHISDGGKGVQDAYNQNLNTWFRQLSERLRYVRVVCGDWTRVCGGQWQDKLGIVGMFFDPPYGVADRDNDIYHHDSTDIAHDVRAWCLERGGKESYRIVVAGYEEHEELLRHGWRKESWKARGGYANVGGAGSETRGMRNRHRECLYYSPHCAKRSAEAKQTEWEMTPA